MKRKSVGIKSFVIVELEPGSRYEYEKDELIHLTYDQLADGSRAKRKDKPVDPKMARAIRKAFGIGRKEKWS